MNRLRKILLSQNNLAKALGLKSYFSAVKHNFHLEIINDFKYKNKNILVLSPHPDDDVFALGGTMAKLSVNNNISIIYFCDGSGGTPDGRDGEGKVITFDKNLIKIRRNEAISSVEKIGKIKQIFINFQDGFLICNNQIVKELNDLIVELKPDIIFTPSPLDNHPDHRATNDILINAINEIESSLKLEIEIWLYEIWTPIFANRIVDISNEIKIKEKAIFEHKSQLKCRNYNKAIIALNQYRAEMNGISGFAEAFFATTPEIYVKLYRNS